MLTSIADRLTPSSPIELTFGAQPTAVGRKYSTIFAHKAATGGSGLPYSVYTVINVGDGAKAKAEVDLIAGVDSQASKMVKAFVDANVLAGRANYPAVRVVLIPNGVTDFGPADAALEAVKFLRSDMFVSCYAASATALRQKLQDLCVMLSGPDRDLSGQFGSFYCVGSLEALASAVLYNINSRYGLVAYLQDTNTALVALEGDTTSGSKEILNPTIVAGINEGATLTGTGIPAGSVVVEVHADKIVMSLAATATATAVDIDAQNVVSQALEIIAAAHAAGMMSSAFPYNPLQNVSIGGLKAPKKRSDWIAIDPNGASEQALIAGLSPLTILPDGSVGYIRTRTTYTTLPGNITVTAYFDWQDLVVMNDFKEVCYQVTQLPPFNNNPGGTKASLTIAALLKDEILREAQDFEDRGAFQGVKVLSKLFQIEPSSTSRGRFDFKIPVNVLPGLYVIAGNIQGVSDIGNFQL